MLPTRRATTRALKDHRPTMRAEASCARRRPKGVH
jgi:hypothetical protein